MNGMNVTKILRIRRMMTRIRITVAIAMEEETRVVIETEKKTDIPKEVNDDPT